MLDIRFIRENVDLIKQAAVDKRITCDVDRLIEVDRRRRELQQQLDALRTQVRENGQRVGLLRNPKSPGHQEALAEGKGEVEIKAEADRLQTELTGLKPKVKELEEAEGPILEEFE